MSWQMKVSISMGYGDNAKLASRAELAAFAAFLTVVSTYKEPDMPTEEELRTQMVGDTIVSEQWRQVISRPLAKAGIGPWNIDLEWVWR